MNKSIKKAVTTFNVARSNMLEEYKSVIPMATESNILDLKNIFINSEYRLAFNNFIDNLIDRIALTIIRNKTFNNPLSMFKKGSIPLGSDVQEIYENPANGVDYQLSEVESAKLFKITTPDTMVAYHRLNRQRMFTKSITYAEIELAFTSWDKFNDFVDSITNSLYSGNYIEEFQYTKNLVDAVYENDKVIVEKIDDVVDDVTANKFLQKARATFQKFKFPSEKFNAYNKFKKPEDKPATTWSEPERIVLIIDSDFESVVDVQALAKAFNINYANFLGRVITIDNFKNTGIKCILCDESFLQIYDKKMEFTSFFNPRTLIWNYYLHVWQTYSVSPFANAIVFATETPVPLTDITWGVGSLDIDMNSSATKGFDFTLVPSSATTDIKYEVKDTTIATVSQTSNTHIDLTGVKVGVTELVAKSDNGFTKSITINITNTSG